MSDLKIFENEEFGNVRCLEIDGNPWFVGRDVADILGYANTRDALAKHVDKEDKTDGVVIRDSIGREQMPVLINESGLYSLILSSKLPNARSFKRWVTSEVLPSIRKTGSYYMPQTFPEALRAYANEVERNERLSAENKELKPKADYFDGLVDRNLLTNLRDTAKELGVKEREFIKWLEDNNYIYRDIRKQIKPYAQYSTQTDNPLFKIKEWKNEHKAGVQTLITPYGKETFRLLFANEACEEEQLEIIDLN